MQNVSFNGEIDIDHNGSLDVSKNTIGGSVEADCDAVKPLKMGPWALRSPDLKDKLRKTRWNCLSYLGCRSRVEFRLEEHRSIDKYCHEKKNL